MGVANQVGAVADQVVGPLGDPDPELAREPRRPCGRARSARSAVISEPEGCAASTITVTADSAAMIRLRAAK